MPSWKTHLTAGVIVTIVLIYASYLSGYWSFFSADDPKNIFFWFHIIFISLLGSLMPDFDYRKTRIRHGLGPALGAFIILSYFYLYRESLTNIDPVFILVLIALFLIIPLMAGLVIPFRHHGKLHSLSAAGLYGACWAVIDLLIFDLPLTEAALIGAFGFVAYFSHLFLDSDLKLI